MDSPTGGTRRREVSGEKAGRDSLSDFDLAEVSGLPGKTGGGDTGEPDWLYIATPDPAFFIRDAW